MKFIHAADVHLGSQLRGLSVYEGAPAEAIRGAIRRAFTNMIDFAIQEKVDFVLLAGDVFDTRSEDFSEALFFNHEMGRLKQADIRVFMISGNHDAESVIVKQLKFPSNVTVFSTAYPETVYVTDLNVAIHGQGFAKKSVTDDLSKAYPDARPGCFNIGLLHSSVDGYEGHANYAPCTVDGLRSKGYGYWALGHVHQHKVLSEEPWVVFSGNLQGRHARETGGKGFVLAVVEDNKIKHLEHRYADVFRWGTAVVDLAAIEQEDGLYDRVEKAILAAMDDTDGRQLALRIHLHGATGLHHKLMADRDSWINQVRGIADSASNGKVWIEKVLFDTQAPINVQDLIDQGGPLAALLSQLHGIARDDGELQKLAAEFADLSSKLPAEAKHGPDALNPTSPDSVRQVLKAVEQKLIASLLRSNQA